MIWGNKTSHRPEWLWLPVSLLALIPAQDVTAQDVAGQASRIAQAPVQAPVQVQAPAPLPAGQSASTFNFNIPAQPLPQAIAAFSSATGLQVLYSEPAAFDHAAPALRGVHTARQALTLLLDGSGLIARYTTATTITLERLSRSSGDGAVILSPIMVEASTGTAPAQAELGNVMPEYPGGQVARGGRVGMLGNQEVFDTPFSMTSYTAELMKNRNAQTVSDVVRNDSSVYSINAERGDSQNFSIRGFNYGGNSAPLYDGLQGLAHRRLSTVENLERVEVFKGANSLLSGAVGRVGGTINLLPKRPLDKPLTEWSLGYEYGERFDTHLDLSRRFGPDEVMGLRFNGTYRDGESVPDNNDRELKDFSLALDLRLERFRASLVADYIDGRQKAGNQQFSNVAQIPAAPDISAAVQQPWEVSENNFMRGVLRMEYDLTENWTAFGAYGLSDFTGSWLRTIGSNLDANGNFNQTASLQRDAENNQSGQVGLRGSLHTGPVSHKLSAELARADSESGRITGNVAGYAVTSNIFNPVFVARPDATPLSTSVPVTARSITQSAALADVLGFFDDRVLLTLGVRHQRVAAENISATTGATTSDYDKTALTPAVGLLYKPWKSFSIYGNYIEALEQGATAPSTAANAGEIFAPAKTNQVEFGVKYDLGYLGLTASIFEMVRPSGITDPVSNVYGVDGEQRNRGVEFNAFGELTETIRLLGGVTYLDAKTTKTQNGTFDGFDASGVPDWSAVMGVEWDTPFVDGLTLNVQGNYVGGQYVDAGNTKKLPSYTLFGIGARYTTQLAGNDLVVRANVSNLFNKDYWLTFPGVSNILYYGAPRVMSLTASMRF